MAPRPAHAPSAVRRSRRPIAASRGDAFPAALPLEALDERIAIVGTAGSGKTYAAKGFVERLLETGAHVTIVDPLGVWWGLRASADGVAPGYPVVVFGGRLPSPAPEMLRTLAAQGEQFMDADELAAALGKKADRRPLEFRDRRLAQQWPDRNRRATLPNRGTLSRVNCLPYRSAQASKYRTLLVAS